MNNPSNDTNTYQKSIHSLVISKNSPKISGKSGKIQPNFGSYLVVTVRALKNLFNSFELNPFYIEEQVPVACLNESKKIYQCKMKKLTSKVLDSAVWHLKCSSGSDELLLLQIILNYDQYKPDQLKSIEEDDENKKFHVFVLL